ncbi:MAG: hypothetical protein KC621_08305 [Myxococcales bacterium]|nr:hypothetical protein [Myxococcales bacterium]
MPRLLAILTLAATIPATALAGDEIHDRALAHHVSKKVLVRAYDPIHHDLVVMLDDYEVVLHTDTATVHGQLTPGRLIDVNWEDGSYVATQIIVRPDRLRAMSRP